MGRGRQKAKATRVARDLKYSNTEMDLERLSKELHGEVSKVETENDDDPYAEGNYIARA
jgi:hypothetical protein